MIDDETDGLARFTRLAGDQATIGIVRMSVGFHVVAHQTQIGLVPERHAPERADLVVHVEQIAVGFGRSPAFIDMLDAEALDELAPQFGREAGAHQDA